MSSQLGWIAGLLEGEGYFGTKKGYPCITLNMTDEDIVRRAQTVLGGNVSGPYNYRSHEKPIWQLNITKQAQAAGWMMTLYPMMGLRRQARIREILLKWRSI